MLKLLRKYHFNLTLRVTLTNDGLTKKLQQGTPAIPSPLLALDRQCTNNNAICNNPVNVLFPFLVTFTHVGGQKVEKATKR